MVSAQLLEQYEAFYEKEDFVTLGGRIIGADTKAANIIALCSRIPHDDILEIGAGDGAVLSRLRAQKFGSSHLGLEVSASAVEKMIEQHIPALAFDGSHIPFEDSRFDLAILSHVVEHLENPRELIREAARVARYVFIEVPLEDARGAGADWINNPEGHINYYTERSIRFLVQSCGLTVHNQKVTDWDFPTYVFENGYAKGLLKFLIKRSALNLPALAPKLFTFNSILLAS